VIFRNENGQALTAQDLERHLRENPGGAVIAELGAAAEQTGATRIELDKPFPENTAEGRLGNAVVQDVDSAGEKFPLYHTVKQVVEEIINSFFEPPTPNTIDPPGCELNGTCHPAAWPCPGAPGEARPNCPPEDGTGGGSGTDDCVSQPCAWQGEEYCPPDWAPGGWYGASNSQFSDGLLPRQLTQQDRIEHCICQATDPSYAATGTPSVRSAAMCPAKREQVAHFCLAAQWGPDQPIPPECLGELQPAHTDNREWMGRICDQIRCPENQDSVPAGDHCACISATTPLVGDPVGELCRQRGWAARCEEGTSCVCGAEGYGDLPYNDPTCRNDPTTFPGSLDRLSTPNPDRLLVFTDPRTPNELFLGMRDDSRTASRVVSAVLPALERSTLPAIGTGVSTRLLATEAASSGVIQLYLHNAENNVFHEFADQCELRTLTPGQATACDLTPDNSQRRSKWNDCFRSGGCAMELTMQGTPAAFDGILGFTAPVFNGTLTATGTLPQVCPRPAPDIFVRDLSSLWEGLGGTRDAPSVDITLGSGTVFELPPTTFTINPNLIRFVNPG
jgi:hypothetical protein